MHIFDGLPRFTSEIFRLPDSLRSRERGVTSSETFRRFAELYQPFFPPLLRDVFSEPDRQAFLAERFEAVRQLKRRHIRLEKDPVLWNGDFLEIALPDLPFLVDMVLNLLGSYEMRTRFRITALFSVQRDEAGNLLSVDKTQKTEKAGLHLESWTYFSLESYDESVRDSFLRSLEHNLNDLERMVEDFPEQLASLAEVQGDDFFQTDRHWLIEHFVLMGTARVTTQGRSVGLAHCLGILRNTEFADRLTDWMNRFFVDQPHRGHWQLRGLHIYETDLPSEVKRRKPLHVALFTSDSEIRLLIGSFASKGELSPRFTIPPLHRKIDAVAAALDIPLGSHSWRELYRLTQLVPLGFLFTRSIAFWKAWFGFLLDRQHIDEGAHLFLLDEEYGGCWLVRTVFDGEEIALALRTFFHRHNIVVRTELHRHNEGIEYEFLWLQSEAGAAAIRELLVANEGSLLRSYRDRLLSLIADRITGAQAIRERSAMALHALNEDIRQHLTPGQFLDGLLHIEKQSDAFSVQYESHPAPAFHVFSKHAALLSEMTPAFDSCGLSVEHAIKLDMFCNGQTHYRHLFFISDALPESEAATLCEVLSGILNGRTSVELLNRLSRRSDFTLRRLRMLKALLACLYQMDRSVSRLFLMQMMLAHAGFALALLEYAEATFAHDDAEQRHRAQRIHTESLDAQIALLRTLPERMAGLRLKELLFAVVRTNFLLDENEINLKIESRRLSFVQDPKPLFEIFVYAVDFEGVHLRFGPVSRGGIRWSDRIDDFRVEILGLVHTQRVKNTMIVPEGSKGGFVLKQTGMNPAAGKAAYRRFMAALLRMTDNLSSNAEAPGRQIRPEGLVCLDGFDPYLVVAADRGTARFSDTANEVSAEHRFWIGDAFASGGSNGYDHKKQGITAKGAWQSVKSHFASMNIDPESDVIRCVGIGDMSGDVFGNGMLLSRTIKLIAAFNHRFIFIDPDPDPARSFEERKRLFEAGLDWDAYAKELISAGGAVYERDRADLTLSPEARRALGMQNRNAISNGSKSGPGNDPDSVSGDELVRAILCADVDLLWNGGIGTYVKARSERNEEIGDPANDAVRVDGGSLRARVVGEGGNLGFSMQGRYEAAAAGVLLNTDAVDNSGGVDMSDHEVNLKILLEDMLSRKLIASRERRNEMIRELEPLMIDQVLANNRAINRCIRMEERRLSENGAMLPLLIQELLENDACESDELPPDMQRLTSPLVGNLVGWSKLYYRARIDLRFEDYPEFVERRFKGMPLGDETLRDCVQRHPLRDAIAKTEVINHIVHHAGPTFLFRLHHQLGLSYEAAVAHRLRLERWIEADRLRIDAEKSGFDRLLELETMMERAFFVVPSQLPFDQSPLPADILQLSDYERMLDRIRLFLYRAPEGLHRLQELHLDELENSIRLLPALDRAEMRFQGRLLLQLEQIRSVAVHERVDARRLRKLMKSVKEARRIIKERPAPIALYELFREILEEQQAFTGP